jgi:lysozyme
MATIKTGATTISDKGLNIIKQFEGLRLDAYKDVVGVPTIGWGTTHYEDGRPIKMSDKINISRAQQLLQFEANAKAYVIAQALQKAGIALNQNQFDACVSLAYNIGVEGFLGSTAFKRIKANPCDPTIRNAFAMWCKGTKSNGEKFVIDALVKRRKLESDLYFS